LAQNTSNKRRAVTIHPPARLVGEPKKTKKKKGRKEESTKERHPKQWKTGYSPRPTHVVGSKSNFAWWVACGVLDYDM